MKDPIKMAKATKKVHETYSLSKIVANPSNIPISTIVFACLAGAATLIIISFLNSGLSH